MISDCSDVRAQTNTEPTDGRYTIQPEGTSPFSVLCKFDEDGDWTIIQNNPDTTNEEGDEDSSDDDDDDRFWEKDWSEYRYFFGELDTTKRFW